MNSKDIRVIERRGGSSFLCEAAEAILVRRNIAVQYFDGDRSIKLCVVRQKDLTHSAAADKFLNAISSNGLAGRQCGFDQCLNCVERVFF